MLSNKWTFSLKILVIMLSLCFVASSALAQFEIKLNAEDEDVSHADNAQVVYGTPNTDSTTIKIMSTKVVNFTNVVAGGTDTTDDNGINLPLEAIDFTVIAYNKFGGTVTTGAPTLGAVSVDGTADGMHFMAELNAVADDSNITRVLLVLPKDKVALADPRAELAADGTRNAAGKNKEASIELHYVSATEGDVNDGDTDDTDIPLGQPVVHAIARADGMIRPVTAATFDVLLTLSEEPKKDGFKKDHIDVTHATAGDPTFLDKIDESDGTESSGRDMMLYRYIVTLTPKYENKNDIVVKVKSFYDQEKQSPNMYMPPATPAAYMEGMDMLTVKVGKEVLKDKASGLEVKIGNETRIPKDGYLVIATNIGESGVADNPENDKDEPKRNARTAAQFIYNAVQIGLPNLETFLGGGGIIDVVGPEKVVISEINWGSDASLQPHNNSQWIELQNKSGKSLLTGDGNYKLVFYGPNEAPPAKVATAAVAATATMKAQPAGMALPSGVQDRVGTIDEKGAYWSLAGKGMSGRSGLGEEALQLAAVVPTQEIISMYRVLDADGMPLDGQMASSWMQSTPPGVNYDLTKVGVRVGSPGAARLVTAAETAATEAAAKAKAAADAAAAAKAADTSVMMPAVGQIYISEVMFAGGGTLPQWIEISNGSRTEQVNLSGWTLTVDNAAADADVSVGASIKFTIPEGTKIDPSGQNDTPSTILVVTEAGRNNVDGTGQVLNLWTAGQTELILAGVTKRRYSLLSDMAFQITLAPPAPTATTVAATATAAEKAAAQAADAKTTLAHKAATDMVGNLGADDGAAWALPMNMEGGRSSILRGHVPVSVGPAEPEDGTMMDSWALASDTSFAQVTHIRVSSYYGAMNDVGTPGFRAGGALPVELSHFRPARNKETGAVVITWSTQSELNNAGFFIKRSQQRTGEFVVINATMVPGAGTTSEKQFYTYEDTTAQPNVVYYYQIEDVSLDGNRQTLTRGIRLKGHIGAAGKATTTWGDLKTQE